MKTIGLSTPVTVRVANPHGVRRVSAYLEQNGARYPLFEQTAPAHAPVLARHAPRRAASPSKPARTRRRNLKEGKARLVVEAGLERSRAAARTPLPATSPWCSPPPRVIPDGLQHYINQGGMELVTFTASGAWSEAGVKVGQYTFRSFPLPGGDPDQRFAMFAYPWDLPADFTPLVFARNAAGTEATAHFWFKLFPKKFRVRDFPIDDALMEKLVNSVDPTGALAPGKDLVTRFLYINGELRRKNNQQLADLRLKTEEKVLWNGPFLHWGKEEADFADVRNYIYHGQKIDQQVHLGLRPIRRTQNAPVSAANDGRVVWAVRPGHLRQLHRGGPRLRAAIHLRPPARDRREGGRHGEEGPEDGHRRPDRPGRRGARPLQHADRRRADQPPRVVGRALDQGPHPEQAAVAAAGPPAERDASSHCTGRPCRARPSTYRERLPARWYTSSRWTCGREPDCSDSDRSARCSR